MNHTSPSPLRRLAISLALLALTAGAASSARAAVQYTLTDLGTFGGSSSYAYGINNSGQIAGYFMSPLEHAFLYSDGHMTDLGTLGGWSSAAYGINNSGQVVGSSYPERGENHAFLYTGGAMIDLRTLGGSWSDARAINASGQVVGLADTGAWIRAFLYSSGVMTDLGTLGGSHSQASGINDSGQVVGNSFLRGDVWHHAFLYSGGAMIDLGTLGGNWSDATAINASGQIVGWAGTADDPVADRWHAFLLSGGTMADLGTLGGDYIHSCAYGINATGQVVGSAMSNDEDNRRAFLWSRGGMTDLNSLIPGNSGWILKEARAINDIGQIVGYGTNPSGQKHAFLLTPFRTLFSQVIGTNLAISWFTNSLMPLSLFQNTNLASANWAAVTNSPTVTNQMYRVLISPASSGNRFYRLQSQ